jgi:hypothetical protein
MVVLGTGDSVPVIMELNPKDGSVYKFISLQKIGATSADQPKFYTFSAIYHDIPGNN